MISYNLSGNFKNLNSHEGYYPKVYACLGKDPIEGDPVFNNVADFNFHLKANSPAINAGMPDPPVAAATEDLGAFPIK